MNFKSVDVRITISMVVLILFAVIAGASVSDIAIFSGVIIGVLIIGLIISSIKERMKKNSRKEMESNMTDFTISRKMEIGNDSVLYYDESKEQIRLCAINTDLCKYTGAKPTTSNSENYG